MNKQPRSVDTILKEYNNAKLTSQKNLDTVPVKTRPGHEAAKRKAIADLPKLRIEYLVAISKKAYGFFVSGDQAKSAEFARIAGESGAFTINAAAIYEVLADKVRPSIGGRNEFSSAQAVILERELKDLVEKTGYETPLNRIILSGLRVVTTREQLVGYIRELVMRSNGNTPASVYAQDEIIRQALASEFTKQRLVVTVLGASNLDRQAISGLFTKTAQVDVDLVPEVTERFARDSIMGVLNPGYVPAPAPQTQPEVIEPANEPTTTEPQQEN